MTLTNADSYTGGTTILAGTLQLGSGGSLASTGLLTIGGGTFDLNGNDQTVAGLTIIPGSAGSIMLGDATLTVNQAGTTQFNGVISGEGGLTKTGAGLLSLTGASAYTGATTVDAGTLRLDPRGGLASTSALIVDGGIFDLENGGQTVGSLSGTGGAVTLGNGSLTVDQATATGFAGSIGGDGRPDQGRYRHLTLRHQRLHRRHTGEWRDAGRLDRRQSGHGRDPGARRGHDPFLPRRRDLIPMTSR